MSQIDLSQLDESCKRCAGTGKLTTDITGQPLPPEECGGQCYQCRGSGRRLTTDGKALLDFLERWLPAGGK